MPPDRPRPLTARQRAVLACIDRSLAARGYPPTVREIGAQLAIGSPNGVSDHLRALARKGYLRIDRAVARGLVLLPPATAALAAAASAPAVASSRAPARPRTPRRA